MPRLRLGEASRLHGEAVQGLGRGWGSTEGASHDGRARAVMAGGGACFSRRAPAISSSGEALGVRGRGADARGGARAAAANPLSVDQASDRTRGSLRLPEFKRS
jgi:hypothetical protein